MLSASLLFGLVKTVIQGNEPVVAQTNNQPVLTQKDYGNTVYYDQSILLILQSDNK